MSTLLILITWTFQNLMATPCPLWREVPENLAQLYVHFLIFFIDFYHISKPTGKSRKISRAVLVSYIFTFPPVQRLLFPVLTAYIFRQVCTFLLQYWLVIYSLRPVLITYIFTPVLTTHVISTVQLISPQHLQSIFLHRC